MALSPLSSGTVLMQLGSVMRMGVIYRPSVAIKSPYVADLRQNPFDYSPFTAILDAPASPVKDGKSPSKTALKKERKEKLDALKKKKEDNVNAGIPESPLRLPSDEEMIANAEK